MYGDENLIWVSKSKMHNCTGNRAKKEIAYLILFVANELLG